MFIFLMDELHCFGPLEGMKCIKPADGTKNTFTFYRKHLFNYETDITCKVTAKETRQGGIYYSFTMKYTDVDNRDRTIKSGKTWTIRALMDDIINTQRQIIA